MGKKISYDDFELDSVGVDEYSIMQEIDSELAYDEIASTLVRHGNMDKKSSW